MGFSMVRFLPRNLSGGGEMPAAPDAQEIAQTASDGEDEEVIFG